MGPISSPETSVSNPTLRRVITQKTEESSSTAAEECDLVFFCYFDKSYQRFGGLLSMKIINL